MLLPASIVAPGSQNWNIFPIFKFISFYLFLTISWNWLGWKTWVPVSKPNLPNFLMMYCPMLSVSVEFRSEWRGNVNTFSSISFMWSLWKIQYFKLKFLIFEFELSFVGSPGSKERWEWGLPVMIHISNFGPLRNCFPVISILHIVHVAE